MIIPAGQGVAARLSRGDTVRVINTHGSQVVDFWAFNAEDLGECMSMEHTHTALMKIIPGVGDGLVTNQRRRILTIVADTSPGVHDTLIASCDAHRYAQLGHPGHANCTDNLARALAGLGLRRVVHPCPFNLFQNTPVAAGGKLSFAPPLSRPGDSISFRAEIDAIVAFSACPMDLFPVNGADCVIHDAHFEIT